MTQIIKIFLTILAAIFIFSAANALEIKKSDSATYSLMRLDGSQANLQLRLTQKEGKWRMEGRPLSNKWLNCPQGCEYWTPSVEELSQYQKYLTTNDRGADFDFGCIRNSVHAFCKVRNFGFPYKFQYELLVFAGEKPPIVMSMQRITKY